MFQSFTDRFVPNTKESAQIYPIRIGVLQGWTSIIVKVGISQKQIVECCQSLENDLKNRFTGFEINIKVSPMHH